MTLDASHRTPHLEWEAIQFPLILTDIKFERHDLTFDEQTTITLWRDENFRLHGLLTGRTANPRVIRDIQFVGKGNIIKHETIKGTDQNGHMATISGCVLGGFYTNSSTCNENGLLMQIEIVFDTIHITYSDRKDITSPIHYEWYLIEQIKPHFWGRTVRSADMSLKAGIGIDEFDEENKNIFGKAFSRDYFVLELPELNVIVGKVPKELVAKKVEGLCLEFRGAAIEYITPDFLDDLKYFLSFLLGARLYYMGYSEVANGQLITAFADDPNVPYKMQSAFPPIHYNQQYEWGNFALQANLLFPVYRKLQDKLTLNHAIERFWVANEIPVGMNLPVLAGAMEVVAVGYLKMTNNDDLEYLPKSDYDILILEELKALKQKIATINGGDIILSKIRNAFRKGPNEKINLFFNLLGINTGKSEKEAINLRNKMTHSKRDYTMDETVFDDLILTRVYQVLFNRIILKLLNYQGYYIDYSLQGCPSKPLGMQTG